jgi:hypothetical protein
MAEVAFQYQIPQKMIGTFVVDAFLAEGYNFSNQVTDIPVEEGSNISDHIVEEQDVVTVEAYIGNTAFEVVNMDGNTITNLEAPDRMSRVIQAYFELKRMVKEKQLFDVVLGLETFTNMAITTFTINREAANGANLPFSMEFRKIKIIKSDTTEINASNSSGGDGTGGQTGGTTNAGTSSSEQPRDSIAKEEWRRQIRSGGPATPADYQRKFGVPYPQ